MVTVVLILCDVCFLLKIESSNKFCRAGWRQKSKECQVQTEIAHLFYYYHWSCKMSYSRVFLNNKEFLPWNHLSSCCIFLSIFSWNPLASTKNSIKHSLNKTFCQRRGEHVAGTEIRGRQFVTAKLKISKSQFSTHITINLLNSISRNFMVHRVNIPNLIS